VPFLLVPFSLALSAVEGWARKENEQDDEN